MNVDRKQFLLLTAALATTTSGGCGPRVTAELPPPRPASASMLPREPAPAPTPMPAEPEVAPPQSAQYGGPVDEFGYPIAPVDEYGYGGPVDEAGMGTTNYGGAAYQTAPVDPRCAGLKAPGPTCESFEDTRQSCSGIVAGMEPPVADRVVQCLQRKSGTQGICNWNVVSTCLDQAAAKANLGNAPMSECQTAANKCSGRQSFDVHGCRVALSNTKPARRDRMASCITEFCGVGDCAWELTY